MKKLSLIWLALFLVFVVSVLEGLDVFDYDCGCDNKLQGVITVLTVGIGAWWAFRNEDLKRGWIKYNYYEREDGTRVIIVHNAGRTAAENVILHYATSDGQAISSIELASSMFEYTIGDDLYYKMVKFPEVSPGQEFALEIKSLSNIFYIRKWNKPINKSDVQLSYKYGSNQNKHISRVKLDKSFMWYKDKDKVTYL